MDSHEEKIFNAMRDAQQKEAEQKMREKAKELQRMKLEAKKAGLGKYDTMGGTGSYSGISSSSRSTNSTNSYDAPKIDTYQSLNSNTTSSYPTSKSNRAMKLGNKDSMPAFIEQAKQELQQNNQNQQQQQQQQLSSHSKANTNITVEKVHLRIDEKINLTCGKDGGVQNLEVLGILYLKVASEDDGRIRVAVQNNDTRSLQLQTHPNVDKKLYTSNSIIGLKDSSKSFPPGQDVGVLKWRYQAQDENEVPLKSI
jgi:coatomer subunit delta